MRVALVHDYFVQDGGAERVLLAMHALFPQAPIFTLLADPAFLPNGIPSSRIQSSPLQPLLFHPKLFPLLTPLLPIAAEHLDLSAYDTVFVSSSSFAKGVITPPSTRVICYLHTPTRFLWEERHHYLKTRGWPKLARLPLHLAFHKLRAWDYAAAQRPATLLTNSALSQARITRYYGRSSDVVHPPIDLAHVPFQPKERSHWLTGGRLVPYKRFDVSILAANSLRVPLKIFGTGPDEQRLKALAGPTIEFLGTISEARKWELFQSAHAFLHPHLEDFGMTILESLASGTPVIALGKGGALETLRKGENSVFIKETHPEELLRAMQVLCDMPFDPSRVRASAEPFDLPHFHKKLLSYATNVD